jgi:polyisoprenoid-binding protein YceI
MTQITFRSFVIGLGIAAASANAQAPKSQLVAVDNGVASFHVRTNIPALEVSGKSASLQARVRMHRDSNGVKLEHIEAWVSAATLKTGMSLRDEHMRKRIFTTSGGEVPDLRFESGDVNCPGVAPGREATCAVTGTLAIRGASRAFSIPLKVRQDGSGTTFHAVGDGVVKLSDYGIEQPSQLGVKTSNEVSIHLDLSGKEADLVAAAPGRR